MKKALKRTGKIALGILAGLFVLLLFAGGAFNLPWVQTRLARVVTEKLTGYMDCEVTVSAADITLSKRTIRLYDFTIRDRHDSITVYAREGIAVIRALNEKTTALAAATLIDPCIYITRYEGDSMSDFKRVIKKIASRPKKDTALRKAFEMDVFRIENAVFTYNNEYKTPKDNGCIDFRHIRLYDGYARGRKFYTRLGAVYAQVDYLEAKEQSGVTVEEFVSGIYVNRGELHFNDAYLRTPQSEVNLIIGLTTDSCHWKKFKDFLHNVKFDADIREPSTVSAADLRLFAPVFGQMQDKVRLSGKVNGPVCDFDLRRIKAAFGQAGALDADVHIKGIPSDITLSLNVRNLQATREDVESIVLPSGKGVRLPAVLDAWQTASVQGRLQGWVDKFETDVTLETNLGSISVHNTAVDTLNGPAVMQGHIAAERIRLDKLFKKDSLLGSTDFDFEFYLSGRSLHRMICQLEGSVQRFTVAGHALEPIRLNLHLQKDYYRGLAHCSDPDFDFRLFGTADFRNASSRSNFTLAVNNIDLSPFRFMHDTGAFTVSSRITVRTEGNRPDSMEARLEMENTRLHRLDRDFSMKGMVVSLGTAPDGPRRASVKSDVLQADIKGDWGFYRLGGTLDAIVKRHFPAFIDTLVHMRSQTEPHPQAGQAPLDFTATLKIDPGADTLLSLFYPEVRIPFGLGARLSCSRKNPVISFSADLPYVQYKKAAGMRAGIRADFSPSNCGLEAHAGRVYLNEEARLTDMVVILDGTEADRLSYGFYWNADSAGQTVHTQKSSVEGDFRFYPGGKIRMDMDDCRVSLLGAWWKGLNEGYLYYAKDSIVFHNLGLKSEQLRSGIKLNGELSHHPSSVLQADFKDFSLDHTDGLLRNIRMDLDGEIDGYARIRNFYDAFSFDADLSVDSLNINGKRYGRLKISAGSARRDAIKIQASVVESYTVSKAIFARGAVNPVESLRIGGTLYPRDKGRLDFEGKLKRLPVDFLKGILAKTLENMEGTMDGIIKIKGSLSKPELYLKGETSSLAATIPALQTRYSFSHFGLTLTSSNLTFDNCLFADPVYKTQGKLSGGLYHNNFKDIRLDIGVDFDKLLVLNTKRGLDMPFWGTVFGTGSLKITGPVKDIHILLNAEVNDNSDINFDFANTSSGNGANFIRFVTARPQNIDTVSRVYERFYARTREAVRQRGRLTMDLNLAVTPGLAVTLGLRNPAMDGRLAATGSGMLRLLAAPGSTQLFGTYTIDGGSFDFSMADVISKRFVLEDGGTISWVGPMTDARINIRADYQTKAGLYPVLASFNPTEDEARQYKQKAGVKSVIILSGNLMSPEIDFDIDLLNTDDDTRDKFYAVVKKDDKDEMLRQTFSLLMFNSFMTTGGGAANVGNTAISSSTDFVFSQFNNFLSHFTDKINVGMNYRPKDQTSNSEFQVSMSGQFFDDRLIINGSLGVTDKNEAAASGTSTVVGDIDVEWKFTEEIRLKGFNHSNDQDLTKPVNSYTQGVGVVFKRDFDNWKEFLHGTKAKMTKEERMAERNRKREIRLQKRQQK